MTKKRKTRQEKIILQLKRQLAQKKRAEASQETKIISSPDPLIPQKKTASYSFPGLSRKAKNQARQEAISEAKPKTKLQVGQAKKAVKSIFFYDPSLIRKDLLKSLALTLIVIGLELMLYLKLR